MTNYVITVIPKSGEPYSIDYKDAERYSVMVRSYRMSNIKIEFDPSLMVNVSMRLPRNHNYTGD